MKLLGVWDTVGGPLNVKCPEKAMSQRYRVAMWMYQEGGGSTENWDVLGVMEKTFQN